MSKTPNKFSPEVRERAVRMVLEHRDDYPSHWAAVVSVSQKIGCARATLHDWIKKAEIKSGKRDGIPDGVSQHMKALEREVRELRPANEILRRRRHILRRRSPAASSNGDFLYRGTQAGLRGRANLQSAAGCPISLSSSHGLST